jgi:hypothetical protein
MRNAILGAIIGFAVGFLAQAFGWLPTEIITRALSQGSPYFITIAYAVTFGVAIVCAVIGAVVGFLLTR